MSRTNNKDKQDKVHVFYRTSIGESRLNNSHFGGLSVSLQEVNCVFARY